MRRADIIASIKDKGIRDMLQAYRTCPIHNMGCHYSYAKCKACKSSWLEFDTDDIPVWVLVPGRAVAHAIDSEGKIICTGEPRYDTEPINSLYSTQLCSACKLKQGGRSVGYNHAVCRCCYKIFPQKDMKQFRSLWTCKDCYEQHERAVTQRTGPKLDQDSFDVWKADVNNTAESLSNQIQSTEEEYYGQTLK